MRTACKTQTYAGLVFQGRMHLVMHPASMVVVAHPSAMR